MSVLVIAECGINHNGSEEEAYKLIDAAVESGADVAKFQLFDSEIYNGKIRHLALSREQIKRLAEYCNGKIGFACTAFDADNLRWLLANTKMEFVKISSGKHDDEDIANVAHDSDLMVIQSIDSRIFHYKPVERDWHLLHVVPIYPTPPEQANIQVVQRSWCSGLSDHSGDIFMPLAAVALGAKIIECHITMSKEQEGFDHKASLEPQQFKEMICGIRAIEKGIA